MASKKASKSSDGEGLPFGAGVTEVAVDRAGKGTDGGSDGAKRPRKRGGRRSGRRKPDGEGGEASNTGTAEASAEPATKAPEHDEGSRGAEGGEGRSSRRRRWQDRRSRKKRKKRGEGQGERPQSRGADQEKPRQGKSEAEACEGMLMVEKAGHAHLRRKDNDWLSARDDVHVAPRLVQKYGLRDGSMIEGTRRKGQGRHKWDLVSVEHVDGKPPDELKNLPNFKSLTSIDPDFHYAVGDASQEVSLKVLDLICPVGRGQRGLIVAPPRSGKTILLRQFAKAIETTYPEVHLMVLLVDERPEEATEWRRSTGGEVFVSTNDEMAKRHVEMAEVVWKRSRRLVEMGEDVILLLDSITRLGRAYNNVHGNSGKTMSGGIDTRALERPKQFFGAARNTETAGSLTILGTTLIETGSRMDQVIFEEFKGTGNMELVLSRKLADRRIFPAIDLQRSGTRKDEKLHSTRRLHRINTLRRVLMRMHFTEAMELLITKLDDVEKVDEFLARFDIDPEE